MSHVNKLSFNSVRTFNTNYTDYYTAGGRLKIFFSSYLNYTSKIFSINELKIIILNILEIFLQWIGNLL